MSEETAEDILSKASAMEREYEWLQASQFYKQALGMVVDDDYIRRGEIQEKIGYSLHMNSFQFERKEEFINGLVKAVEAYNSAQGFYEQMQDDQGSPWILRCKAFSKYLSHWIVADLSEKLRLLTECHMLKGEALNIFWDRKELHEFCRTYSELEHITELLFFREWDPQVRRDAIERELSYGKKAIQVLPELDDPHEAARVNIVYARYIYQYRNFIEPSTKRELILNHVDEALRFAEEIGDFQTKAICNILIAYRRARTRAETQNHLHKALECAEKTRDIYLQAFTLAWKAYLTYWWAFATEDPDQRIKWANEAMEFYDRSQILFKVLSFQNPVTGKITSPTPGGYAEYYLDRAAWETTPEKKLELLGKSEKDGLEALTIAEGWGIPLSIGRMCHILSRTLTSKARLETDLDTTRDLLLMAREYRERNLEIFERLLFVSHNVHGVFYYLLAEIIEELALIEPDPTKKMELLEDVKARKEKCLNLHARVQNMSIGNYASLSGYQIGYGTTLTHLYELTDNREHLRKAIDAWQNAIGVAKKVPLFGRIAESYWKIANTLDILGEHAEASEKFENASENYLKSAESIPQLNKFYQNHACYMQAWSEFEKAKQDHVKRNYVQAKEHYEKSAELHEASERWSYLSPNYLAWARLEDSEDLSRREQTEDAKENFELTANLFREAGDSIRSKLNELDVEAEIETAEKLLEASNLRQEYCLGRMVLEEARILDRQGDHLASSRGFGQAANRFQKFIGGMERDSDKREIQPIIYLCQAWEKMMLAEARGSSTMYGEASDLFIVAKEYALDQTTSFLAQAHSSFCLALKSGTEFEISREIALFSEAKRHIEAATTHYLRAGNQTMSDYAGATSRLLDAYLYSYNAQTEADPEKKAQFYQMAERLLQSSAGAYLKAKHPEKSDEVRRILNRVKEEREIAVSLSEVLHAPTIASTTTSFSIPTPTHERANGIERFDNADIQANLIARRREVGVGEDLNLEIELVNAGKAPAQLVKVEDIVIEGFELKSYPEICRVEDSYLDMKGRTLSPLKTQELKLVLKPLAKGVFELKPRILYLDEAGKYKSHEPDPVSITVQELGIRGWLRGPTR
jgi:hypothetical protein